MPSDPRRVLLHTEVMREHLLAERTNDGWVLTGLVDFEPAMIGAPGYELASIGVFVTCGDSALRAAFTEGYGDQIDALEVMAYALLHRYSNLRWYLERVPPPSDVLGLEALAHWFFGA